MRAKRLLGLLLAAVLIFSCTPAGGRFWKWAATVSGFGDWQEDSGLLEIHLIDVGKADAVLIKSQGRAALLDAGKSISGGAVADYLSRHGVEELDWLIMSHPDGDHIGGMAQILWDIPVGNFLQAAVTDLSAISSPEAESLQRALALTETPQLALEPGESFGIGGEALLTVLGPLREYDETNNNSLVLRLTCGGFTALFCGDTEYDAEQDLLLSGQNLRADLLKVGHHGSRSSSSLRFVWEVSPRYAAISTGPDRNELPREEVLSRLEEIGAEIYRTDTDGNLIFAYDGENITVKTEK